MGVRVSRCDVGVGAADDRRRALVCRQPERDRLFARRGERLRGVDVRRAGRRARVDLDRSPRRGGKRLPPVGYAAYFSDQKGFVYAVDAATGKQIWMRKVDDHPLVRLTGSPTLYEDRLYVPTSSYEEGGKPPGYACCTFRGAIVALDARTGDVIWKSYTIAEEPQLLRRLRRRDASCAGRRAARSGRRRQSTPGAARSTSASATPTAVRRSRRPTPCSRSISRPARCDGSRQMAPSTPDVFGCTPGDVNCGERAGPDFDFGASPVLAKLPSGRELIVAGQKSGVVYALDPDRKGAQVWRYRAGGGSGLGGIQWGIAADGERVYVPVAEIYSPTPGGLHAVDLATGARVWYSPPEPPVCGKLSRACSGAQFSAVTAIPGIVFSPSNDGRFAPIRRRTAASSGRSTPTASSLPSTGYGRRAGR